ncbi:MAG: hypothetical protein ABIG93_04955 [archaeon]
MDNLVRNLAIGAGALVALAGSYVAGSATNGVDTLLAKKIKINRETVAVVEPLDLEEGKLYEVGSVRCGLNDEGKFVVANPVNEWATTLEQRANGNYRSATTVTYSTDACPLSK